MDIMHTFCSEDSTNHQDAREDDEYCNLVMNMFFKNKCATGFLNILMTLLKAINQSM